MKPFWGYKTMRGRSGIKQSLAMLSLIVFAIVLSGMDAFGQFGRLRRNDNSGPATRAALKAEIVLESNPSARTEWKLATTKGEKPAQKVLESPKDPGDPAIILWDFGEMGKSSVGREAKFRVTFYDSDGIDYEADFTFLPKEGKIRFVYNTSIGYNWEFDKEGSTNLTPNVKMFSTAPRDWVGADTKEEWTLGGIRDGKTEGTAVFKLSYRGDDYTEVKIIIRK